VASRRTFGATWWGGAWIDALEQRARLDANRLPRGRTYARQDRVGALEVSPGIVEATVRGSRFRPYHVTIRVRPLTVKEWDRVLDAIAGRAAHAAALLDGDLPAAVLADTQQAGVELLPTAGELRPRCTCPDSADPCKHAAAVCYLMADELDRDPFALLHLRGRTRDEVLEALRARRASHDTTRSAAVAKPGPVRDATVVALDAFARPQPDAATLLAFSARPAPAHPGHPAPLPVEPPAAVGITAAELSRLSRAAAERAWHLLRGD
jgi:uncharacterized Zn finger protein